MTAVRLHQVWFHFQLGFVALPDSNESLSCTDFSEKLLVFRMLPRVEVGGGVSLRQALRLAALTLCTRRRCVTGGFSSLL